MAEPQVVASRYALWKAAIKWPMYSVAVMPALLASGWLQSQGLDPRWGQLGLFLLAAVLLLGWENLSNDVFDDDTGVDTLGKPHSLVALTGRRDRIAWIAHSLLAGGLLLMALVALRSQPVVLLLVLICCGLGYLYQGPPFRLGYRGLGEPLGWLAFGPFATAAALMALQPPTSLPAAVPWQVALSLGAGPALATNGLIHDEVLSITTKDQASECKKVSLRQLCSPSFLEAARLVFHNLGTVLLRAQSHYLTSSWAIA